MSVGGGHQSPGTELAATDGQNTTILTFPLAVGEDQFISFRLLVRARTASTRLIHSYIGALEATRASGQTGSVGGQLLLSLGTKSGADTLDVSAVVDNSAVAGGVVSVNVTPSVNAGTPTAITIQAVFDALPTGAVVK